MLNIVKQHRIFSFIATLYTFLGVTRKDSIGLAINTNLVKSLAKRATIPVTVTLLSGIVHSTHNIVTHGLIRFAMTNIVLVQIGVKFVIGLHQV